MIRELVSIFMQESAELVDQMEQAIPANAARDLQRAAHTLKSASDMFGGQRVRDAAFQLEMMGKEGRVADAPPTFAALKVEVEKLRAALRKQWGDAESSNTR